MQEGPATVGCTLPREGGPGLDLTLLNMNLGGGGRHAAGSVPSWVLLWVPALFSSCPNFPPMTDCCFLSECFITPTE